MRGLGGFFNGRLMKLSGIHLKTSHKEDISATYHRIKATELDSFLDITAKPFQQ